MTSDHASTKASGFVHRHEYPCLHVYWHRATKEDGVSGPGLFIGEAVIWTDGDTKFATHSLSIGLSAPLEIVHWDLNYVGPGSLAGGSMPGLSINERDLQWVTHWAVQALKAHGLWPGYERKEGLQ